MSNEQPPVRKVIPYKSGKRPSTFRRLNIDFAGTALEEALNEQERQREQEKPRADSAPASLPDETTLHQSPPLPTTPHLSIMRDAEKPEIIQFSDKKSPSSSSHEQELTASRGESPPLPTTPHSSQANKSTIAPARDFNRRANSLDRDAMPSGLFPGAAKKVYDALYIRTRGAAVPTKSVRASRRDLLTWTGIRNLKTIDNHIRYLMATGLIVRKWELGSNEGSSYEIRLPEEVNYQSPPVVGSGGEWSPLSTTPQKTGSGYTQKMGSGGEGQTIDNIATSENYKTYKNDDDENDDTHTLREFTSILVEAARCVVGGELVDSEQERERWNELGRLLAEELKEAAQRTESISSVPAFFTAHLRRRLARKAVPSAEVKKPSESARRISQQNASRPEQEGREREAGKVSERETAAAGKSKFSLEECLNYAEHLHKTGQGITNPGGYATIIHRTGEADELIERFLRPSQPPEPPPDVSLCPDCKGTGYWYPQGTEHGVARCRHERLQTGERGP